jgi:hypothetical protein
LMQIVNVKGIMAHPYIDIGGEFNNRAH